MVDFVFPTAGFVPHEWLFQRVAAVVRYGGAGTTAAGLRAGLPTITVPFGVDRPYWGNRVFRLGAGPAPIPRKRLNAKRFSKAILEATGNRRMIDRAREIGEKLQSEDGAANAADIIERVLNMRT